MKVISWNVNGLRAVYKRNFLKWFRSADADFICLQEIKVQKENLPPELINIDKFNAFFNFAQKPGYSGVAIYARKRPMKISYNLGLKRFDDEGRFIALEYPGFSLINVYLPHGGRGKENLGYKLEVYKFLISYLKRLKDKKIILIGDFNVAHQEIDLARPKQNKDNIMFTPKEREQLDKIVDLGFTDTWRMFHKEVNSFTWWPYFANARARNLGWRIDYCFTTRSLAPKVKKAFILSDVMGSDHCPVGIEF
jgi:exodeoxyribonuclease-3